ncbi:MAG: M20/M25/M40 family metallo-hydrolase [Actinomycetota bacterium]|nr:M20/M25/M40 family metallo-hydrolase [Actinomycetota bacterium]
MNERGTGNRRQTLGMWFAVVVCLIVAVSPILAPPAPTGDDPGAISVDRALEHVEFIAREPHVMGTPEIERVREYLLASLSEDGLEPETLTIEAPDYFGVSGGTVDVINVLARIPGTGDGKAILFMAHYDTVPTTSGANDNSAAVAALLEVARILAGGPPLPNDVIFLFTDGEEPTPRFGAWGFAEYHPWFDDVVLAVNLEGIAIAGPTMLVEMSGPKGELVSRLANAVPDPVAYSFMTKTAELIGGAATDFDVFRDRDVPGYNFTYMRGTSIYHTPRDSIANLNIDGLAHHGSLALGIARDFGSPEVRESGSGDAVFFTVPFRFVVRYSTAAVIVSLFAVLLLLGGALWIRITRYGSSTRGLLSGLGVVLLAALASVAASTFVWIGLANLRPEMGLVEGYTYLVALMGLTGVGWCLAQRRAAATGSDIHGGLLMVWLAFALLAGSFLPAFGYLLVWPAIAAGIAEISVARSRSFVARLAAVTVVALTTFVVLVPAVDIYFHFASPRPGNPGSEMPATIVLPVLLAFLAIGLVATRISGPVAQTQ